MLDANTALVRDKRRLTAIVSADVVGYSRLMGRDESGTLATLDGHLRELIDPKIAEHGGRTVKSMGDEWVGSSCPEAWLIVTVGPPS